MSYLKKCFSEKKAVGELIHQKMMKHFYRYLVVGGMPDAVREYTESGDMNTVSEIQRNITLLYKRDFTKYESGNKKLIYFCKLRSNGGWKKALHAGIYVYLFAGRNRTAYIGTDYIIVSSFRWECIRILNLNACHGGFLSN